MVKITVTFSPNTCAHTHAELMETEQKHRRVRAYGVYAMGSQKNLAECSSLYAQGTYLERSAFEAGAYFFICFSRFLCTWQPS